MAVFNLTAAEPLMKVYFNPRISKQFNTAAVLFNRFFDGKGIPISNRGMEIPTHMEPNAIDSWYSDGGNLPVGSSETLTSALVGYFSYSKAVQFTGSALDSAGNDSTTYARALTFNVKMATINAIKALNIYSFGDGTGILANVGVNVTLSTSVNTTVDLSGSVNYGQYLRQGQVIDFIHNGAVASTATIVSISQPINISGPASGSGSVTMVVGPATVAASLVVGDGICGTGNYSNVMAGLKLICDNGSISSVFQNVNRASYNQYNSAVIPLSGSPALSRDVLRRIISQIQILQGRVSTELEFWAHPAQLHAYMDMGWSMKRFNDANKKLDLGYTAAEFEGFPFIVDTDCPKDHIFLLDRDLMFKVTARELSFDDRTGSILKQVPSSTAGQYTDTFVAFLLFRGNIGTYIPNAHGKISGLGYPAGY